MRKIQWVCDWCKKVVSASDDGENDDNTYIPIGWYKRTEDGRSFCSEKCLKKSMTKEELEDYKSDKWTWLA